ERPLDLFMMETQPMEPAELLSEQEEAHWREQQHGAWQRQMQGEAVRHEQSESQRDSPPWANPGVDFWEGQ
ncbi:MAG TPA: hypothetical protein VN714_08530, partial [Trebonia sp.]|nr:hypothetical protein [Trebonia sp.]